MRVGRNDSISSSADFDAPQLDVSGGESAAGLLSRLKSQNSALEKLRSALDDDDPVSAAGLFGLHAPA